MALSIEILDYSYYGVKFKIKTDTWHPLPIQPTISEVTSSGGLGNTIYLQPKFFNTNAEQTGDYGNLKQGTKYRIISNGIQISGAASKDFTTKSQDDGGGFLLSASKTNHSITFKVHNNFIGTKTIYYKFNNGSKTVYGTLGGGAGGDGVLQDGLSPSTNYDIYIETTKINGELFSNTGTIKTLSETDSSTSSDDYNYDDSAGDNTVINAQYLRKIDGVYQPNGYSAPHQSTASWSYPDGVNYNPNTKVYRYLDGNINPLLKLFYGQICLGACYSETNRTNEEITYRYSVWSSRYNYGAFPRGNCYIDEEQNDGSLIRVRELTNVYDNGHGAAGQGVNDNYLAIINKEVTYTRGESDTTKNITLNISNNGGSVYMTSGDYAGQTNYHAYLSLYNGELELPVPAKTGYRVNVISDENGSATVNDSNTAGVDNGDSCTLVATPNSNYRLSGWYDGGTLVSTETQFVYTPTKDITLEAKFEINQFEIKVANGDTTNISSVGKSPKGTLVEGSDDWYLGGTAVTFTADPVGKDLENKIYHSFKEGRVDDSVISTNNPFTATVGVSPLNKNCTVTAIGESVNMQDYEIVCPRYFADGKLCNTNSDNWDEDWKQSMIFAPGETIYLQLREIDSNYTLLRWEQSVDKETGVVLSNNPLLELTTTAGDYHYFRPVWKINSDATCQVLSPDDGMNLIAQPVIYDAYDAINKLGEDDFIGINTRFIGIKDPNEVQNNPELDKASLGSFFFMLKKGGE